MQNVKCLLAVFDLLIHVVGFCHCQCFNTVGWKTGVC